MVLGMKLFVAAKAVVMREDGKVLIVRESSSYVEGTNEGMWLVVGLIRVSRCTMACNGR